MNLLNSQSCPSDLINIHKQFNQLLTTKGIKKIMEERTIKNGFFFYDIERGREREKMQMLDVLLLR